MAQAKSGDNHTAAQSKTLGVVFDELVCLFAARCLSGTDCIANTWSASRFLNAQDLFSVFLVVLFSRFFFQISWKFLPMMS